MSRRVVLGDNLARTSRAVSSFAITCSVALSLPDIHVSFRPEPVVVSSPAPLPSAASSADRHRSKPILCGPELG